MDTSLRVTVLTSDEFDTLLRQLRESKPNPKTQEAAERGAKMLAEFDSKGHVIVKACAS